MFAFSCSYEITRNISVRRVGNCAFEQKNNFHRRRRRMAANQRAVAEFKLVLVGDGGVGMSMNRFGKMLKLNTREFLFRKNNICQTTFNR